jgi:hypothetical protein
VSDGTNAELSFYCKAYRLAELKRFRGFNQSLLVDQDSGDLSDDDIVFMHPNYCVTRSVFLPRQVDTRPSAEWIEFCRQDLKFQIPADIADSTTEEQRR